MCAPGQDMGDGIAGKLDLRRQMYEAASQGDTQRYNELHQQFQEMNRPQQQQQQ